MASIDNRVVEMKFDNTAFESKLQTTIESLGRLETSLKLPNATKGFSDINTAANTVSFNPLTSGIENLTAKFSSLSIIGITVLTNIANKAVDAGIKIAESLSLQQVLSGFQEYETNMRSIQTILANTKQDKTTLSDVNSALDILNEYSDKTIYNFSQMTRNIGTFTAAGVDLDTSTQSIKGIANLAAISGSSSEQASSAMYQLSQAIATGTLKLIDWNSVTNAGMGGQVFQSALFETGKALGTIKNVPIDQTFEQWTDAGNTFRGSLEKGWVTSEVLTTTLRGFTGEMDAAQLKTLGYTDDQAKAIIEMGNTGVEAATKVRTFTQLMETAKESVASGFSQSFRIILGDFETATVLFSGISSAFSKIVQESSSARNEILQKWSDLGGREAIISGLTSAASSLNKIINRVKAGFARIFPPITAITLTKLSFAFEDFMKKLSPSQETLTNVSNIFQGIFAAVEIGFTIIKELAGSFKDLFTALGRSEGASTALDFIKGIADNLVELNKVLVTDGGIAKVFDAVTDSIIRLAKDPLGELKHLKDIALEIFGILLTGASNVSSLPTGVVDFLNKIRDAIVNIIDRVPFLDLLVQGFTHIRDTISSVADSATPVIDWLKNFSTSILNWFKELKTKMADAAAPGDFSKLLDGLNLALIGGIGGLLAYLSKGINLDFGGLFEGVKNTLSELTGVLKGMQMQLKADALLKIAYSIGVLAIAVLLISGIDSIALTKSLTALGVGLAGLMASLSVLAGSKTVKDAGTLVLISAYLIGVSTSLLILALAIKVLSSLSTEDLAKGVSTITVLLGVLIGAVKLLSGSTVSLVAAGVGLIGIAIALNILAGAVMIFAQMSWEDIGKGLLGITVGLLAIAIALKLMPWDSLSKGAGLLIVATSLAILAGVVMMFASMSLEELARGFGAVAVGLIAIALAMKLMPMSLPVTAAGLLLVSISLLIISKVLTDLAALSWADLGKGLAVLAGSLILLALGAHAMNGAIGGAIAMGIMSIALSNFVGVLKTISTLSWADIVKGLLTIAATFAVVALAGMLIAPAIGPILALGAALLLIGIAIALFGIGLNALARGVIQVLKIIGGSIDWFVSLLDTLLTRIPDIVVALLKALLKALDVILEALPVVIKQLVVVIGYVIDGLIKLLPKIVELVIAVIDSIIDIIDAKAMDIFEAGYRLLIGLIKGITNHIDELVTAVIDLIATFINSLAENIDKIIEAGVNLLKALIQGIIDNIGEIATSVGQLITAFMTAIVSQYAIIIQAGVDLLVKFLSGIKDNITKVTDAVVEIITTIITALGDGATQIAQAGADALSDFLGGISDGISTIGDKVEEIITKFLDELGSWSNSIIVKGIEVMATFIRGLGAGALTLVYVAAETVTAFAEGIADAIEKYAPRLRQAGVDIAFAVADGFTGGLAGKLRSGDWKSLIGDFALGPFGMMKNMLGINSPSKLYMGLGEGVVEGFALGMSNTTLANKSATNLAKSTTDTFTRSLQTLSDSLNFTTEFNPTITPVLDLTNVRVGARQINGLISSTNGINATVSTGQAQTIAATETQTQTISTSQNGSNEVRFEQNIYAPTQLSTSDIYRQTRNQITLAKEELSIL